VTFFRSITKTIFLLAGCTVLLLNPDPAFTVNRGGQPFFRSQLIFKPSLRFPRCHSSTIIALPDGSLLAAWWNSFEEGGADAVIRASRLCPGEDGWAPPRILVDTPDTTDSNPVFLVAPGGRLWLFYRAGLPWAKMLKMESADLGRTWNKPSLLINKPAYTSRSSILTLANGDNFIPVMTYEKTNRNKLGRASSAFIYSSDGRKTWKTTGAILSEPRSNEPAVIQRADGSLLTYMRPYDPEPADRFLWQSESFDNGRTWSEPGRTRLRNPSSAVELKKLRNGHVVLAFNDSQEARTPLCLALSLDDGHTWSFKRVLEDAPGRFSYPTLTQSADGHIHVSYTFRRTHVKHAEVNEAWIMEKPWTETLSEN
jgi:predicted neuraminidase